LIRRSTLNIHRSLAGVGGGVARQNGARICQGTARAGCRAGHVRLDGSIRVLRGPSGPKTVVSRRTIASATSMNARVPGSPLQPSSSVAACWARLALTPALDGHGPWSLALAAASCCHLLQCGTDHAKWIVCAGDCQRSAVERNRRETSNQTARASALPVRESRSVSVVV